MTKFDELLFQRLPDSGIEYIAHAVLGGAQAHVEFASLFEEQPVVCEARITSLPSELAQFIEVDNSRLKENRLELKIGLHVSVINEPTVLKVIKMIRQYKQLKPGRHEFLGAKK